MKTHYTFESLKEVQEALKPDGKPVHLNEDSALIVHYGGPGETTSVRLKTPESCTFVMDLEDVIREAMDLLGIKVYFDDAEEPEGY